MGVISRCSSTQKLQNTLPFQIGDVYYQDWVSGIQNGGSGTNVYIQIISNTNKIELDSIYFHGRAAKLELINNMLAIGRFSSIISYNNDIVMSSNPNEEFGNKVPELKKKPDFELKDNQCVISYKIDGKTKYFMIDNIRKKELLAFPGSPNNME